MSFWAVPIVAAKSAVAAPTQATTRSAVGLLMKKKFMRPIM